MKLSNFFNLNFFKAEKNVEGALDYRRLWKITFFSVLSVTLAPLIIISLINFSQLNKQYLLQREGIYSQMERVLSLSTTHLAYFLEERRAALEYVSLGKSYKELKNNRKLFRIFKNLRKSFGGFVDLGILDPHGVQQAYVGPYNLKGRQYKNQSWYQEVLLKGTYISDVFLGYRNSPHFVIAVRHEDDLGSHVLRATIDTDRLEGLLKTIITPKYNDAFLINQEGIIQTSSYGQDSILSRFKYYTGGKPDQYSIFETLDANGMPLLLGLAEVKNSPFILVAINHSYVMLEKWSGMRINLLLVTFISIAVIVIAILLGTSYLVNQIYEADLKRIAILHEAGYHHKLASIGRLAAGVAHEINNPLAVINEKVGLMEDIISQADKFPERDRFIDQVHGIQHSVKRMSDITHRLLGFARHLPIKLEKIDLDGLIKEVLEFLGREAEYRSISISLDVKNEIAKVFNDRGQLQQVFLNIINNAIEAVDDGGSINILLEKQEADAVKIYIKDDGPGISPENIGRIFEPFYSTNKEKGTGLGLSITHGIIKRLGGKIDVKSHLGEGTTFIITLPVGSDEN